jgi:uncharacterized membrane protein
VKNVVFALLTLVYPLAIWLGGGRLEPRWLAVGLVSLAVVRLISTRERVWLLVGAGALALAALAGLLNVGWPLKLYPVVVNASMLALFGATLVRPPSMVERFARLQLKATGGELPAHVPAYTRKVTMVWCGFFVLNGTVAALTALFASEQAWALYNGGLSYGLMGALFGGELVVRQVVKRRAAALEPKQPPLGVA